MGRNLSPSAVTFKAWINLTVCLRPSSLFSNPYKEKKTTIWSYRKSKAEERSVGRLTMPRANLAVHNETHKHECVVLTCSWC